MITRRRNDLLSSSATSGQWITQASRPSHRLFCW